MLRTARHWLIWLLALALPLQALAAVGMACHTVQAVRTAGAAAGTPQAPAPDCHGHTAAAAPGAPQPHHEDAAGVAAGHPAASADGLSALAAPHHGPAHPAAHVDAQATPAGTGLDGPADAPGCSACAACHAGAGLVPAALAVPAPLSGPVPAVRTGGPVPAVPATGPDRPPRAALA